MAVIQFVDYVADVEDLDLAENEVAETEVVEA